MQTSNEQLKRQQLIMKVLGFFQDNITGVWGPTSIAAKKKFEASPKFAPGVPNNGLPFREGVKYPAGIMLRKDGLLWHPQIDKELDEQAKAVSSIPEITVPRAEVQVTEKVQTGESVTNLGKQTQVVTPVDPTLTPTGTVNTPRK